MFWPWWVGRSWLVWDAGASRGYRNDRRISSTAAISLVGTRGWGGRNRRVSCRGCRGMTGETTSRPWVSILIRLACSPSRALTVDRRFESRRDHGGLITRAEHENYHLRFEFRWGDKRWPPRETAVRDSGCCYHSVGPNDASYGFWMKSFEFQLQEGDCGDLQPRGRGRRCRSDRENAGRSEKRSALREGRAASRRDDEARRQVWETTKSREASGT